jgi:hypothetical protein
MEYFFEDEFENVKSYYSDFIGKDFYFSEENKFKGIKEKLWKIDKQPSNKNVGHDEDCYNILFWPESAIKGCLIYDFMGSLNDIKSYNFYNFHSKK